MLKSIVRGPILTATRRSFAPSLTLLEDRCTPASVSGNTITLDDANELLIVFTDTAGTYTLASTTDIDGVTGPVSFTPAAGLVTIVDAATGTGVGFTGSTVAYANPFGVTLDDSSAGVSFSGTSAFGDHPVSVTTDRNISVSSGASVTAAAGGITLSANQQAIPTAGNFVGVDVRGAVIGGTGAVSVTGRGGDAASGNQYGVAVRTGSTVSTTGGGGVTVFGTGGPSPGSANAGVLLAGANTLISSGGGNVSVTGVGGQTGVNSTHYGVTLNTGAMITAGGSGSVTVHGTGGGTPSAFNGDGHGVLLTGSGVRITSSGGDVSVTGISGPIEPTSIAVGTWVSSGAEISAGGTGAVSVLGVGEYGVLVTGGTITSGGGSVNVVGTATDVISASGVGTGVVVGGTITAGGSGSVTVTGTGGGGAFNHTHGVWLTGAGATITSGGGSVTVTGVAGGDGTNGGDAGVRLAGGGVITAGGVGTVAVQGTGGGGSGLDNHGVQILDANSAITSGGGAVSVTGIAGAGTGGVGVSVTDGATLASGGTGALTLTADSVSVGNTAVVRGGAVGGGRVTVQPLTPGTRISLGGADVLTGSPLVLGLTDAELDRIAAGTLVLGSVYTGDIVFVGTVSVGIPLHLITSGGVVDVTAGEQDDLVAPSLAIEADTGVGSGDSVNVSVGTLAIANGISGHVRLTNNLFSTAGPLSLGVVDGVSGITNDGADIDITQSGDLTVSEAAAGAAAVSLQVDGNLNLLATITAAGSAGLTASGSVLPAYVGTDVTTGSGLTFGAGTSLGFAVTGTVPDVEYPRLITSGSIDLTGTVLALGGAYVPVAGDTFTIVSGTAVTGTFTGLPHGSVVSLNGTALHVFYSSTTVTLVANLAPIGGSSGGPYTIGEGDGLTVSAPAASDPDGDALTYTWDVNGDGTFGDEALGTVSNGGRTVNFASAQLLSLGLGDGTLTRSLAVRVSDGLTFGTTTATGSLTVSNVAPTITALSGPTIGVEASPLAFTAAATDPAGALDLLTYLWSVLKDGVPYTTSSGTSFTFTPNDNGSYTVSLSVSDGDGGSTTASRTVVVENIAPTITDVHVPAAGVGGKPLTFSATGTDPAGASDPLTYSWTITRNGVPVAIGTGATFTFTPVIGGTFVVTLTLKDGDGGSATDSRVVTVTPPPRVVTAVGNTVRVLNPLDNNTREFTPYPGFTGGVTVAIADLNGDGLLDIVTGAGAGGGPHVKVFDGASGAEVASFYAFDPNFSGGVFVAAGGGRIVVGAGAGGGPHVKAFALDGTETASFFAYDASFTGGVRVAVGDLDGDGVFDIVTGAGAGGGPHVKAFDGVSLVETVSFFAFDAAFSGGVFVATANGRIAVGADAGGGPHVKLFNQFGVETLSFYAFDPSFSGGVRVGFADADLDLLTGAGPGGGPNVKAFNIAPFAEVSSFFVADPLDSRGVYVG